MTNFSKYLVLVLLLLLPTGALSPSQPLAQMTSVPGGKSSEAAAMLKAGQGSNETRTIDLVGRGTIYHDDVAGARDRAIADALQGVVERAVGLVISQASVVEDFQLLSDRVYDQTEAFIDDYKVLTESKSGQYYRVMVRATVSMSAIKDRLQSIGILVVHKGLPTIMFFLSEQNIGEPSPKYWWGQSPLSTHLSVTEKALSEYMREKGFVIADRAALDRDVQLGPEYMGSELSDAAAVRLGKELGADLVIIGKAVVRYSGYVLDKDMRPIQARVSTRAVRTDSGMAIALSEGTGAALHSDDRVGGTEALNLSASVVARDLVRQIVAKWRKDVSQPVLVELVVKGIREYADFVRFRTHLRNDVRGVRNVYLRGIRAGEAKMDVDFMGNAKTLADELMFQRFENLVVNISEVSEKGVILELMPILAPES
jgi:hypothetical protein